MVAADNINYLDDEEAQNILEDTINPQKYDPLEFWHHIQSQVYSLSSSNDLMLWMTLYCIKGKSNETERWTYMQPAGMVN